MFLDNHVSKLTLHMIVVNFFHTSITYSQGHQMKSKNQCTDKLISGSLLSTDAAAPQVH